MRPRRRWLSSAVSPSLVPGTLSLSLSLSLSSLSISLSLLLALSLSRVLSLSSLSRSLGLSLSFICLPFYHFNFLVFSEGSEDSRDSRVQKTHHIIFTLPPPLFYIFFQLFFFRDPKKAVTLVSTPDTFPIFTGTFFLPPNTAFEYKYAVLKAEAGGVCVCVCVCVDAHA